jgi:hypothetical protein
MTGSTFKIHMPNRCFRSFLDGWGAACWFVEWIYHSTIGAWQASKAGTPYINISRREKGRKGEGEGGIPRKANGSDWPGEASSCMLQQKSSVDALKRLSTKIVLDPLLHQTHRITNKVIIVCASGGKY